MGDKHERGRVRLAAKALEKLQEMLARGGIKSRAWFVQNQQAGPGHERAADEHALQRSPWDRNSHGRFAR